MSGRRKRNRHLIIGAGEIGQAINRVFSEVYDTILIDKSDTPIKQKLQVMHICFPYFGGFESEVRRYQRLNKPKYTVIHSTVPVGTSKKCNATHSPVRGVHPFLEPGIRTFTKFIGGKDVNEMGEIFRLAGLKIQLCDKSETTELAKILSTTRRGIDVEVSKEIKRLCKKYDVPFSAVYTLWTESYNKGYDKLNRSENSRTIVQPIMKRVGGHCIRQNAKLLNSWLTKIIKDLNK